MSEVLTKIERQGTVWLKLKAHLNKRLEAARIKNDGDLTDKQTARLRGRIDELKNLLDLGEDKPQIPVDDFKD